MIHSYRSPLLRVYFAILPSVKRNRILRTNIKLQVFFIGQLCTQLHTSFYTQILNACETYLAVQFFSVCVSFSFTCHQFFVVFNNFCIQIRYLWKGVHSMTFQHISNHRSFLFLCKSQGTCCSRCDILSLQEDFTSVSCCRDSANFCSSVLLYKYFIKFSTDTSTRVFYSGCPIKRRSVILHLNPILIAVFNAPSLTFSFTPLLFALFEKIYIVSYDEL